MDEIDVTTRVPKSVCSECGYCSDSISGPTAPAIGDLSLCIQCASLNVLDENLQLRKPTEDEYLAVAASSDFQEMRRAILALQRTIKR